MNSIPFKLIELDDRGLQAIVKCTVNNQPVRLVVDTGASRSVIDSSFVEKLNLVHQNNRKLSGATATGIGNNLNESYKAIVPNIKFDNYCIDNFEMIIIDIEHINKIFDYLNYERINGIIGCDIINFWKLNIDYNNLSIYDVLSPDGNGCQLIANCIIAEKNMRFILDTGASRSVMDLETFNNLPFKIDKEINASIIAGLNSSIPFISEFISDSIAFDDYMIENQSFLSMDLNNVNENYQKINLSSIDGLLGGDILLKHSVSIDFKLRLIKFH